MSRGPESRRRDSATLLSSISRLRARGVHPPGASAPERLAGLRTAEGTGLPANIIEEFRRDMARLALVREQINSIEKTRTERLALFPVRARTVPLRQRERVSGIGQVSQIFINGREFLIIRPSGRHGICLLSSWPLGSMPVRMVVMNSARFHCLTRLRSGPSGPICPGTPPFTSAPRRRTLRKTIFYDKPQWLLIKALIAPIRRLAHFPLFQFAPSRDAGMAGSGDVLNQNRSSPGSAGEAAKV
jgi:hypothetical protein